MDGVKVSVIVPIYNVERYIKRCVKSLINQDYYNIEIILVDDGSPDGSGSIIDDLSREDNRIVVLHEKNAGVSNARNKGINAANGEYIMFVDGDDWVEPNYVSYFLNLILQNNCSIGMNKSNYSLSKDNFSSKEYIVTAEKAIEWIYLGDLFVAVWNKIYRTSLLKNNIIQFNKEIWYGEGMLFNIDCLQFTDNVAIGEKSVYHQTFNPDSAMRKFNLNSNYCGIRSLDIQKKHWVKKNDNIEDAWIYHKYCFNRSIIDGLVRSDMVKDNKDAYASCVKDLRRRILIPLKMETNIKKKISWLCYFISPMFMAKRSSRKHWKNVRQWSVNTLEN